MKPSSIFQLGALVISLSPCGEAGAEYLGVGLQLDDTVVIGGEERWVYRVYAVFDDANDVTIAAGTAGVNSPLNIMSSNAAGTGPGGNFIDSISGAPGDYVGGNLCNAMIGSLTYTPDPIFISGNSYSSVSAQWSTSMPAGIAGNGVDGAFLNAGQTINGLGLAILQLTVNAGDHVAGTISIVGNQYIGDEFGSFIELNQTFTSVVPIPTAMPFLCVITIVVGSRRRRM